MRQLFAHDKSYLLIILSAILVFVAENIYSCYALLTLISLFPALLALRHSVNYKFALFFAITHTAALFGFIWFALPATWLSSQLNVLHQILLVLLLHTILALFVSTPYFVWARIYQKIELNIKSIQMLSALYVLATILSSIFFAILMYSPYNNNFKYLFSLHYFAYSLIDNPMFISLTAIFGVFALIFIAVQFNLLLYKIFLLYKKGDLKNTKRYFLYLLLLIAIISILSIAVYAIRKNALKKVDAKVLLINSNIRFHALDKTSISQALEEKRRRIDTILSSGLKSSAPTLVILPEALPYLNLKMQDVNGIYIQGSIEYKDFISDKLINEILVYSEDFEFSRQKFYLAQFGEYMPYLFAKLWSFFEKHLSLPQKERLEYKASNGEFATFNFADELVAPVLCSENLDALLFLKLPKEAKIISSSNSLSIFSSEFFEQKMIRIFKVLAIASNKNLYFASNALSSGFVLSNGEFKLFNKDVILDLIVNK